MNPENILMSFEEIIVIKVIYLLEIIINQNLFLNDIETKNNIGKYKENITYYSNIVEQNYIKIIEFQNQRYQLLNLKNNQELPIN